MSLNPAIICKLYDSARRMGNWSCPLQIFRRKISLPILSGRKRCRLLGKDWNVPEGFYSFPFGVLCDDCFPPRLKLCAKSDSYNLSSDSVASVILTHQMDSSFLVFGHGYAQSEGGTIVPLLQYPLDKTVGLATAA